MTEGDQFLDALLSARVQFLMREDPRVREVETRYEAYFATPEGIRVTEATQQEYPVAAFRNLPRDVQDRARAITSEYLRVITEVKADIRRRVQEEN